MPYSSGAVATVSSGPVSYKMPVPSTHSRYISGSSSRPSYSLSSSLDRPLYSSLSRTVPRSTSYTDYRSEYKSKYASPSRTLSSSYTRQGSLSDDSSTTRSSVGTRERSVETRERKNSTTSTTTTTTTTLGRRFGTSSSTLAGISVTEMFSKYSPSSYSPSTTSSYSPARYTSSRSAPGGKVNNNEQDDDNGNVPIAEIRRRFDGASLQNGARSSPSPVVARKVYNVTEALSSSEDEDEEEEDEEEEEEKEMTSRRTDSPAGGVAGGAGSGIRRISPAKLQPSSETESNVVSLSPSPRLARTRGNVSNSRDRGGLAGLRNIGNTCFMNSVIQCLSNTKPLLEYLLTDQFMSEINPTVSSMKGALIKAFSTVIHELWRPESEDSVVNTTALKSQIQRFAPRFMGYSQQDAQEFLRYLLEGLHEDVNRVTVKPKPILTDVDDSFSDQQRAAESWKRYLRMDDSKVVDIFVGQLKSTLRCTSCGHCSVTFDPFWDLSLPIPARTGQLKLQQCFDHFTREEVLDGDEKPTCSKCQVRRKCTKSFTIQKFPKILVLHLKRFSPMERFRGKLNVTVDFPLTGLDLSAYAANRGQGCMYNLYGVANHSGTTYSGHYTAYCKHPYTGDWHEYNDSRVSSISSRSVVSSEAYVLFFELSGHSSHL